MHQISVVVLLNGGKAGTLSLQEALMLALIHRVVFIQDLAVWVQIL